MSTWQQQLQNAFTDLKQLLDYVELLPAQIIGINYNHKLPIRVPLSFANKIKKHDPRDPLLLQVLPIAAHNPLFSCDPLQENTTTTLPGLLHKYHGRVLVTLTQACAIHCQFCFRQHFPYADNIPSSTAWQKILDYISTDASINEVILSGGDPLSVSDKLLQQRIASLAAVPHVTTVRLHTRWPVVIPARINTSLIQALTHTRLKIVLILHTNHPQEIDDEVAQAMQQLTSNNITCLSQSVLLQHINANSKILAALSNKLFFACHTLPYYLHMLDKVHGAEYYFLATNDAMSIYQELQALLPGYLVPKLVVETPGQPHKTMLAATAPALAP